MFRVSSEPGRHAYATTDSTIETCDAVGINRWKAKPLSRQHINELGFAALAGLAEHGHHLDVDQIEHGTAAGRIRLNICSHIKRHALLSIAFQQFSGIRRQSASEKSLDCLLPIAYVWRNAAIWRLFGSW